MYRNSKKILILFIIMLTLLHCSDKNTTGNDNSEILWPLSIGNAWSYIKNSQNDIIVQRFEVIGIKKLATLEVPMIKIEDYESDNVDTMLYKNEEDGVYWYLEDGSKFLIFKYPVKSGETWPNPFEGGKIECISTNKTLNTPAGKFNCIVYKFFGEESDKSLKPYLEAYFSINVGWIASKKIEDDENGNWYYETEYYLKSYEIN